MVLYRDTISDYRKGNHKQMELIIILMLVSFILGLILGVVLGGRSPHIIR